MKNYTSDRADAINRWISGIVLFTLFAAGIIEILLQDWFNLFITSLTVLMIAFSFFFQKRFRLRLPGEMQILIVLFIYAGTFLGGPRQFYYRIPYWDTFLHLFSGLALGLTGFFIIYSIVRDDDLKNHPALFAFFTLCFAVAMGVVWEIFEFSMDQIFGTNMQRWRTTGVVDTMKDLIVDSLGAFVVAIYIFLFLKKGNKSLFTRIVERFYERNPQLGENHRQQAE